MNRDKVLGMIIGGAIGDALGLPVETWDYKKIREVHPDGMCEYKVPKDHKWFDGTTQAGTITDDTQLTVATIKGIIKGLPKARQGDNFDFILDEIAREHVVALNDTDKGWGHSTREAVRRIQNNVSWKESGKSSNPHRGTGNGVPMKISPLAAFYSSHSGPDYENFNQSVVDYSAMTHYSQLSAHAAVLHTCVLNMLLWQSPNHFSAEDFAEFVSEEFWKYENLEDHRSYNVDYLTKNDDSLIDRMKLIKEHVAELPSYDHEKVQGFFGNGSCYVYDSLPFSYAYFAMNPNSIDSIIYTVEAGGDTDTNAKMVGEMLGALHGLDFIKKQKPWMIEGLVDYDNLASLGNELCDVLEIT